MLSAGKFVPPSCNNNIGGGGGGCSVDECDYKSSLVHLMNKQHQVAASALSTLNIVY